MWKLDFILQIMNYIYHCLKEKNKKVTGLMEDHYKTCWSKSKSLQLLNR